MKKIMIVAVLFLCTFMNGCKSKESKETKKEGFFPIVSFIKSQVAHVDTSLYQIIKLVSVDSTWDTTYIKREEFRSYASDFLNLPDLTLKEYSDKYEESKFFDASLNRAIFTYSSKDKNSEIQKEEVTVAPDENAGDKVKNIIADKLISSKDSSVTKRMLWNVDESFQVTTVIQKHGQPDSTQTVKITWQ